MEETQTINQKSKNPWAINLIGIVLLIYGVSQVILATLLLLKIKSDIATMFFGLIVSISSAIFDPGIFLASVTSEFMNYYFIVFGLILIFIAITLVQKTKLGFYLSSTLFSLAIISHLTFLILSLFKSGGESATLIPLIIIGMLILPSALAYLIIKRGAFK